MLSGDSGFDRQSIRWKSAWVRPKSDGIFLRSPQCTYSAIGATGQLWPADLVVVSAQPISGRSVMYRCESCTKRWTRLVIWCCCLTHSMMRDIDGFKWGGCTLRHGLHMTELEILTKEFMVLSANLRMRLQSVLHTGM